MKLLARLLSALFPPARDRVDGVTATDWSRGYYTRNRTDLPYPSAYFPRRNRREDRDRP